MARKLNKSGKQLKKIRGKDGRVRAYWTGKKKELHNEGPGQKPGFLARHGGKLIAGAALVAGALAARHKMGQAGVWKGSIANQGAKTGIGHSLMARAKDAVMNYRRGHGGALIGHLTNMAGGAALSHMGAHFGQTAGTAIGSMLGPGGAAIGGFLGGHAGEWLANRHGSGHVARLASGIQQRIQGNHVPNQQAIPVDFGGPHRSMTPAPAGTHTARPPNPAANPHAAASHAAHTHPASQPRAFANPTVSARHAPVSNPINHNDNVTSHFTPRPQAQRQQFGQTYEQHQEAQRRANIRTRSHSVWSSGYAGFGGSRWGA